MTNFNRLPLLFPLMVALLIFILVIQENATVQGLENRSDPAVKSAVSPIAQDRVEPSATPEPSPTPLPTSTPTVSAQVSQRVSKSIGSIDGQTIFNLIVAFIIVAHLAIFGGGLIYSLPRQLVRRTPSDFDNIILEAVKPLIGWLIVAIGYQLLFA